MVSILCTARSGATNLSLYLKNVLDKNLIISPFGNDMENMGLNPSWKGSLNLKMKKDNLYKLMIHRLPSGYSDLCEFGNDIIKLSDKVILFDRKNKLEQSESLAFRKIKYGDDFSKYRTKEPYDNIDKRVVNECYKNFLHHSSALKELSETHNIPIFWYEDLYYGDGLEKISNYLKLKISKTYKDKFLSEDKKERILKNKGDLI